MKLKSIGIIGTLVWVFSCGGQLEADWLRFRGPGSAGVTTSTELPLKWDAKTNVNWKTELPGLGASSAIVVGDRIYVTCYDGYGLDAEKPGKQEDLGLLLLCYSLDTGKELWRRQMKPKLPDQDYKRWLPEHGYASSTPVSDGEAVYAFFGRSGLHAFALDGKRLWEASAGTGTHGFGTAASPILYEGKVIINACVEDDAIIAFDKKSGKEVWRYTGVTKAWCTPVIVDAPGGQEELVISSEEVLFGLDPKTGKRLWYCEGVDDYICPSVVAHDGIVYAIGGRNEIKAVAVRAGGRGEVTESHRLWKSDHGSKIPSPVYHDGYLYWVQHTGIAYCVKASTGEVVYKKRLEGLGARNKTYASVLLADGKLYYVTCYGGTFVLEASPKFRQLAHNDLGDESTFNASPAVVGKRMILRSDRYLYCLGSKP